MLLVDRCDHDGKEDAPRSNIVENFDERNVRIREKNVDTKAKVSETRLDHFCVLTLGLVDADDLAIVLQLDRSVIGLMSGGTTMEAAATTTLRWCAVVVVVITAATYETILSFPTIVL